MMNRKHSKLVCTIVISVVVIGMLARAWPSTAQSQRPPLNVEMKRFLEERAHDFDPLQYKLNTRLEHPSQQLTPISFQSLSPERPNDDWANNAMYAFADYYTGNSEIYTSQAFYEEPGQRTFNSTYDSTPKLNRGSTKVVFISNRDGNNEIYMMNTDGSDQARLTWTSTNEYWPNWSPDGSRICFYSYGDRNAEIYAMNADGSNQIRLTSNSAWDGHPDWSPDGSKIVFSSDRTGTNELWVMKVDGSNQHQLTYGIDVSAYPDWSSAGSRIAFNSDFNHDGWYDVSIINSDGSGLTNLRANSRVPQIDSLAPNWSPDDQSLAVNGIHWVLYQGQYYWVDAGIGLWDVNSDASQPIRCKSMGYLESACWYPDWQTTDAIPPSSQVSALPAWLNTPSFTVQWFGTDSASGLQSYDIQYRDSPGSVWTDWLTRTTQTSANFVGTYGHTYFFRSRARDSIGNLEAYPTSPDAMTTIYQFAASGQILDNRERPVAVVNVQANPAALNASVSRYDGTYDLYFASDGVYTLTTTRSNFSQPPPLFNVTVPNSNSLPTLYLPPLDNQLSDSHFESGNLSAWNAGGDLTPAITSTAHIGAYGARLGGVVSRAAPSAGPWHSTIAQTINVSPAIISGTLSLLYRVESVEPLSDTLTAYIVGASNTLTFTLPVTTSGWTHAWFDLSAWNAPTATVKIDFSVADAGRAANVVLDEISWGSIAPASPTVYLPLVRR